MIAIDIETIPNRYMIDNLPEPEVAYGNLKDPEKRAAKYAEAVIKQQQQMALSPFTGRVCAWAMCNDEGLEFGSYLDNASGECESELIVGILSKMHHFGNECKPRIVTFNGYEFDLPFIYKRAMILGLSMKGFYPLSWWTKRYHTIPHYDIRQVLNNWSTYGAKGSLNYFAKMILGKEKEELDYQQFASMIDEGRGEEIYANCLQHTKLTYELYKRIETYL